MFLIPEFSVFIYDQMKENYKIKPLLETFGHSLQKTWLKKKKQH